jgi:hypothetical protein
MPRRAWPRSGKSEFDGVLFKVRKRQRSIRLTSPATRREAGLTGIWQVNGRSRNSTKRPVGGYRTVGSDIEHVDWIGFWLAATARNECLRSLALHKSVVLAREDDLFDRLPCVSQRSMRRCTPRSAKGVREAMSHLPHAGRTSWKC